MSTSQPEQFQSAPLQLQFLKLGGALITDKSQPHTLRGDVMQRLASEIASACARQPDTRLLLGHGSGSFGHFPGERYGTRHGVSTPESWRGFGEVWFEASALNRLVVEALFDAGLRPVSFPPSATAYAQAGQVLSWDLAPLRSALEHGLLPVVYGDVLFDAALEGTILSTEDLFLHLAKELQPQRVLVAGLEPGVWADYPQCTRLLPEITPASYPELLPALGGSAFKDVTGGMASKVSQLLAMVQAVPGLEALIFSGSTPGNIEQVLSGATMGTKIRSD